MIIQPIIDIAEVCARHGIVQAVICPGSRNAPLTLAFARHPKIKTYVIPDERSAGFIGLGLAQSSNRSVVMVCTSGTAVANLYPSIIEAFYQQVPLLILTADRPPEWIDQQDGQTIRQHNIFQRHVLGSFQFPTSFDHKNAIWHAIKMVSEAILLTGGTNPGPVHINVPIREPFYPSVNEMFRYSRNLKLVSSSEMRLAPDKPWMEKLINEIKHYSKIMVISGQTRMTPDLKNSLELIQKKLKWVLIGDITSNFHSLDDTISKHDIILQSVENRSNLGPDLLITFGQSVLSKNLKNFLRTENPKAHWHVGLNTDVVDPFKSLTKKIMLRPEVFFGQIREGIRAMDKTQLNFSSLWTEKQHRSCQFILDFFASEAFSEFHAMEKILSLLPANCHLHLANSMPVRYANFLGLEKKDSITIWSNRGTSGIDGCLGVAVGHALSHDRLNVIITGDLAFFYDRNSLWHNHLPDNLRIVVLNNHGGGIFRLIDGPKQLDELEEFFETNQKLDASLTAQDFGMRYFTTKTLKAIPGILEDFFAENTGPSILEIETNSAINQEVFEEFMEQATQIWNN